MLAAHEAAQSCNVGQGEGFLESLHLPLNMQQDGQIDETLDIF